MKIDLRFPLRDSHKGQNGKLLIVGGSKKYHGAPIFSILAARRFVDLLYFHPGEKDPFLINAIKSIPEVMIVEKMSMAENMDCVLFGIGLASAKAGIPEVPSNIKLVIDGDGLKRLAGREIPKNSVLTPHESEFRMLFGMEGNSENVKKMAEEHGIVILKKGPIDVISDGSRTEINRIHNAGMTKGGTGDVLAGLVAALCCKNDPFISAIAAARINGHAGNSLMKKYGYNFCASDLADALSGSYLALYGKASSS